MISVKLFAPTVTEEEQASVPVGIAHCPLSSVAEHSHGKTDVMGSIPIAGSLVP